MEEGRGSGKDRHTEHLEARNLSTSQTLSQTFKNILYSSLHIYHKIKIF